MEVAVLIFGPVARAAGADRLTVRLDGDRSCAALLAAIRRQHPAVAPLAAAGRIAINQSFADASAIVRDGDEVALVALVSGG